VPTAWGVVGVAWGVGGHVLFIVSALYRMVAIGFSAYEYPFGTAHWVLLWTWVPMMIWAEGYRGFHLSFSPMVAARARYLAEHPRPLHVLLAPIFCLGLIHATRDRIVRSSILTVSIVLLVFAVRQLEQPWRGIIDLGVIVGLSIGVASMVLWTYRAFTSEDFDRSPDVPTTTAGAEA
jgi:hypothetical protein